MKHDLLQYCHDELQNWDLILNRRESESGDLIGKLSILIGQNSPDTKLSGSFIDQLMVQNQKMEFLRAQVRAQQVRLDHLKDALSDQIGHAFGENQDILRNKMHSAERNITRTKYGAESFLFTSLCDGPSLPKVSGHASRAKQD